MSTIAGFNQVSAPTSATLNSTAVSSDASTQSLRNQATSVGITSLDSYYKTDIEGNVVGVDRVKLNADIQEAKKAQKEQEKIELKKQEEIDAFVKTEKGEIKKEEVKAEANKHKTSIDDEYKKALQKLTGISDKVGDDSSTNIEKLEKELNVLKANKEKLMGSTSTDLQVFEGAGKLLNKINKFFTKASYVSATEKAQDDKEGIFDIKSADEIRAAHNPINAGNSELYENPFFKSAFDTTKKDADKKEFVA